VDGTSKASRAENATAATVARLVQGPGNDIRAPPEHG